MRNKKIVVFDDPISSFDRENLKISVIEKKQAFLKLVALLDRYKNESVIIYCFSRKEIIFSRKRTAEG